MSNFKIPKNGNDMMPFNFGPRATHANVSGWYRGRDDDRGAISHRC